MLDTLALHSEDSTDPPYKIWYKLRRFWFNFEDLGDEPPSMQEGIRWEASQSKEGKANLLQEHRDWGECEEALLYPSIQQNPQSAVV